MAQEQVFLIIIGGSLLILVVISLYINFQRLAKIRKNYNKLLTKFRESESCIDNFQDKIRKKDIEISRLSLEKQILQREKEELETEIDTMKMLGK